MIQCSLWFASALLYAGLFFPLLLWIEMGMRKLNKDAERLGAEVAESVTRVENIIKEIQQKLDEKGE